MENDGSVTTIWAHDNYLSPGKTKLYEWSCFPSYADLFNNTPTVVKIKMNSREYPGMLSDIISRNPHHRSKLSFPLYKKFCKQNHEDSLTLSRENGLENRQVMPQRNSCPEGRGELFQNFPDRPTVKVEKLLTPSRGKKRFGKSQSLSL